LLLFKLKPRGLGVEAILEIVPEVHFREGFSTASSSAEGLHPGLIVKAQAEHDVFVRKSGRVWTLEDHADPLAQFDERYIRVINIFAEDFDFAFGGDVVVAFVDAIEAAQRRCLAAAARADERSNQAVLEIDRYIDERLEFGVQRQTSLVVMV
jgi:hypothetical protein